MYSVLILMRAFHTQPSQIAAAAIAKQERALAQEVVTELRGGAKWFAAEQYHQQYLEKAGQNPGKGSLAPIQCYGDRGPIKDMSKPEIAAILQRPPQHQEL